MTKSTAPSKTTPSKVRKTPSIAERDATKSEKKTQKTTQATGYSVIEGIPESEYLNFENKAMDAMISTIFGTPGIMKGKIIELAGKSDVGKTAMALTFTSMLQKQGVRCGHVDVEKALTKEFATHLGFLAPNFT